MNKKALATLEYNKIINTLVSMACSDGAKQTLKALMPMNNIDDINSALDETNDALTRVYQKGSVDFSRIKDVRASIARLKVGSSLNALELLNISMLLECAAHIKGYYEYRADSIQPMIDTLDPVTLLNNAIKRCIISEDEISDDASANLRDIRRKKNLAADRIHTELNKILNSPSTRTYLQDYVITTRQGRFCLPVKAEYKSSMPGMVHDQSSTGSTLFIEPAAVVKLNNDIRELELKEQAEIEVILASLSEKAAEHTDMLLSDYEVLTHLDCIFAKALLSRHFNCSRPVMNTNGRVNIKKGRHPLIEPHTVVPIDIYLGTDFNLLIITGPNTGGKTVSLKTVGLLTLMAQAGLNIPALEHSDIAVFDEIFADIGDEQSIEQNLSTFSSHMSNIVYIIQHAAPDTLVLFDELNGGTDPIEGAALAIAILRHLHAQGILCIATTHYSELKTFALSTEGIENASCEFDVASLRPTYRLRIGIPGKSNAFAISKKLGLPDYIIEEARTQIDAPALDFESLISDLENSRKKLEEEEHLVATYQEEVETLRNRLKAKQESMEQQRSKLLKDAKEEAREILEEAKEIADQSIRKYQKWERNPAKADNKAMEAQRSKIRDRMKNLDKDLSRSGKQRRSGQNAEDFRIGDTVYIISMDTTGTVLALPNAKKELSVQVGILHMTLPITDCEITETPKQPQTKTKSSGHHRMNLDRASSIRPEINLIGLTVDEAISQLDKYLDDALLSNLSQVRIIHGKGTGALRKAVQDYLKKQKHVASFRSGEFGEGDMGVTIVELH